jgi:hypothetical protein
MGFLAPGVRGGGDLSIRLRHDPCIRRRVEARTHPLVVHPVLVQVELTDLREIARPADRDDGRDVVKGRCADPIAGWKIRLHPVILGR